ncbi:gamma-glutamyltransferase [Aphanothece hegewaldii CCALA 016]|uniref:Gamma-glutamyltransferase n=1 Tax=Aphanothece hegewaldii CCALA 016 TaxID=2107694 RepID=A0A2T1M0D0_9CHRO|nr:gamma-glutamyltransferase family protein [Aphanothece hegewaldii]PSF38133.1 gamma-glutamyltransferase [Aphanothece hegewaldii CCALA 016]
MQFDLNHYPYSSQRRVILGKRCAIATSQHLATLAGIEIFNKGGNAVDAAVASAITLTVVEPTSNGIGGDAFALVWDGKIHGINGSGKSPQNLSLDHFAGFDEMPLRGWLAVTVPGAVALWRSLWEKWGKLPFEELFISAIRHATEGFPVSPLTAEAWERPRSLYLPLKGKEYQPFKDIFFPKGRAPKTGEIWGSQEHAETLKEIATTGGESFYRGKLAEAIANFAAETGGIITLDDLNAHQTLWVEPISTTYRNLEVWEIPPNTQGIAALMALNILEEFDMKNCAYESGERLHRQIEAMKLAFADVYHHIGDLAHMSVTCEQLLNKTYAKQRQQLIQDTATSLFNAGLPTGGTVYLCTADQDLMVSLIQSNYEGFGGGILVPDTGIALHNRGAGFTLQANHPNQVAPSKRPFHTIIPGFLTQDQQAIGPFGVMGAPMQPQGHLQVVSNLVDYHFNPQATLDAPRWRFLRENKVLLERGVPPEIVQDLVNRGHQISMSPHTMFGKGQIIIKQNGVLVAASESRADGLALGY